MLGARCYRLALLVWVLETSGWRRECTCSRPVTSRGRTAGSPCGGFARSGPAGEIGPKGGNLSSRRLTRAERDQGVAVRMTNGRVTIRPVQLGQQRLAFDGDAARQKTASALAALAMQKHESL